MKWDYDKPTKRKSRTEIELQDTFELIRALELKLQKLEAVVDSLYFKAQISHSLLIVHKVNEDDLIKLNQHQQREDL